MCGECGGVGWLFVEKKGISAATRCPCSVPKALPAPEERIPAKPTAKEFGRVLKEWARLIPFFPQAAEDWALIQEDMERYVADVAALESFRVNVIHHCKKYEGTAGLRQIYCAFLTPADGVYPLEPLPGVNQADRAEAAWMAREMEDNERRMAGYKRQALLAPPENRVPLLLEGTVSEVKSISPPRASVQPQPAYSYNKLAEAAEIARSLQEREKDLAEAIRATPVRSEEERIRLVREVEEATEPLRAALARVAQTAQSDTVW
jgi:hypothetical protein